jgi:hypothetical protein
VVVGAVEEQSESLRPGAGWGTAARLGGDRPAGPWENRVSLCHVNCLVCLVVCLVRDGAPERWAVHHVGPQTTREGVTLTLLFVV